jgi:Tfp pilus assembly protein PilF
MAGKSRKEQIQELLELDPNDSFLRYGLAMEQAGEGDDATAAKTLAALIAIDANYVPAYVQAGRALIRLGDDDAAREVLKQGIATATRQGDDHAAGEMAGFLAEIE